MSLIDPNSKEGNLEGQDRPTPRPASSGTESTPGAGPVAWKAAASSVPKLRQQPAAAADPAVLDDFPGFKQDSATPRASVGGPVGEPPESASAPSEPILPLDSEPPFWSEWLDRIRLLPRWIPIATAGLLLVGTAAFVFWPRATPRIALAQIRQHPEAFEGRSVQVAGRAGETFSVGGRYVFNLLQGRDTVVVFTRSRRPRLRERVTVSGTVSIGYLEGVPRVAVLEDPETP